MRTLGTAVLGLSIYLVYFSALDAPFIFDDTSTIVENRSIRQLCPLVGDSETTTPWNPPAATAVYARPLVNLSFAVNYYFGELDPRGYRAVHIVLHFLSALLLWSIIARTLRWGYFHKSFEPVAALLSLAAALVWALHPVVTESVVYITQRTELMMGLLYLTTLYCSIRYWSTSHSSRRAIWLSLATLSCFSGMFCKEMIASAPAMVLLYERTFVAKSFRRAVAQSWPLYVGLALAWIPAIALNYEGPRTPMTGFGMGVAAHQWWFTQLKVFFLYLKLTVWPWPLVIHYEIPYLKTFAEAWPWLLAAAGYAIGTLVLLWRRPAVGFALTWVVAVLSPTLVIPLVGETVAERRMYVPLAALVPLGIVGGYALLTLAWQAVTRKSERHRTGNGSQQVTVVVTALLSIGFGWLSTQRLSAYQSGLSLWQDAVLHQPNDPLVRANLGISLTQAGRLVEAIPHFEAWVELRPDSHWAHYNLARSLEGTQQYQGAMVSYRRAVERQPDHVASHYNLARLLEQSKKWPWAIKHYMQAIDAQPDFAAAHTNLAFLYQSFGDMPLAITHFEAALQAKKDLDHYVNLILALRQTDHTEQATELVEQAIKLAQSQGETGVADELANLLATLRKPPPDR
jgi:Flp pilus assembly protein TadD